MTEAAVLEKILDRERAARREAEKIIEAKSLELYQLNTALKQLNSSLELKVAERTTELERAKEQAEASERAKSKFLSHMSHEIRTPLNAIVGLSEILQKQDGLSHKSVEITNNIKRSADMLMSLINDILDMSAIEAGKVILNEVVFEPKEICQNIFDTFMHSAEEKKLNLKLQIDDQVPNFLIGDPLKLSQVLVNLIGNAMKFTEAGFVKLKVTSKELKEGWSELTFEVSDSGIGIPPQRLDQIFNAFEQASRTTSTKYGGTGLGLSITRQLIQLQNGRIEVESSPGQGTTFFFHIPYQISEDERNTSSEGTSESNGTFIENLKVLLAEDMEMNQYLMQELFKLWGGNLTIVENGVEVLEALKHETYDVLLLDMQMPVMDGLETIKAIRASNEPWSKISVIGLTADVLLDSKEELLKAGVDLYMPKPVNSKKLLKALYQLSEG